MIDAYFLCIVLLLSCYLLALTFGRRAFPIRLIYQDGSGSRFARIAIFLLPLPLLLQASVAVAGTPNSDSPAAFTVLKRIEQQKLDAESKLLLSTRQCVNAASNLHTLFECHRRERDAEWENREKFRRRIEAVRAHYGVPPPGGPGRQRPDGPDGRPFSGPPPY